MLCFGKTLKRKRTKKNTKYVCVCVGYDEEPHCITWDTLSGQNICGLEHLSRVSCLQTSKDGYSVATGCWDQVVRLWA